ncbi:cryptochrome/photolyase family protein [Roseomonas sp. CCTCC AB2023176]|uniref:cryptochrome/photolyase family protein n=1 Tax=Roseomonas sp. CCTCC AB2023176 TaxID=3342640 RepID=UPI0035D9DBDE
MAGRQKGALRLVLGDQLTPEVAALRGLDPARDTVLLAEVVTECTYVRHHKQKIVLVLSAMRHFAEALRAKGIRVRYVHLDDPDNTGTLGGEVARAVRDLSPDRVVVTKPGEWRLLEDMQGWADACGVPVDLLEDDRFLCSLGWFRDWAAGRKQLRMEFFYREMRRMHGVLLEPDGAPVGGQWNYDRENREPLRGRPTTPPRAIFAPDETTRTVMTLVAERFSEHFGTLDAFAWPVTAEEARLALTDFVIARLPGFGAHQDVMVTGEPFLYHAMVSTSLNIGLLTPLEVVRAAEAAYAAGRVPLSAAEGFIRQVLGWREYIRGIYWLKMPGYARLNALEATEPLPWFYWSGETRMNCVSQVVAQTRDHAYAHHIQRLMVTGNLALIAGFAPAEVNDWYMVVYADAFEWVELPNTHGMAIHADGGLMASKPYAASGAYINRMSDYCRGCRYDVKDATGERGCPFNALYWDFVARHRDRFAANPRMTPIVRTLERMDPKRVAAIRTRAASLLAEWRGDAAAPPEAKPQAAEPLLI